MGFFLVGIRFLKCYYFLKIFLILLHVGFLNFKIENLKNSRYKESVKVMFMIIS